MWWRVWYEEKVVERWDVDDRNTDHLEVEPRRGWMGVHPTKMRDEIGVPSRERSKNCPLLASRRDAEFKTTPR